MSATDFIKSIKELLLAVAALGGLFIMVNPGFAQDWILTSAPNEWWYYVVSSADGNKLAAFSFTQAYVSTNSGTSWTSNSLPPGTESCAAAASSADGSMLVAGDECGGIYTSTNSGATWMTNNVPFGTWYGVASSADGSKLAALSPWGNLFYTSTNGGITWTSNSPPSTNTIYWCTLVSSADGNKLAAAWTTCTNYLCTTYFGWIYTSTNSGATWQITSAPKTNWCSIACSADGSKLVAAAYDYYPMPRIGNGVFMSTNSGTTWMAMNIPGDLMNAINVACSTNGNDLMVAAANSYFPSRVYTSTDSGVTWITNNVPKANWGSVASSADGSKLVAAMLPGQVYTWQYRPTLCLSSSRTNSAVFWACSPFAMGYVLQQNSDLASTNWTTAGLPVNDDGTNISVTISPLIGNNYFRLFHP
jgi:photosystem II stability/assembly factor-like uncharacterized protein